MKTKFEYKGLLVNGLQRVNIFSGNHMKFMNEMLVLSSDYNREVDEVLKFTKHGGVIHVPNPEIMVHYTGLKSVVEAIDSASRSRNLQIFISTQSRELIMAAHTYFMDQDSYDFAYHRIDWTGRRYLQWSYEQEALEVAKNSNFEVR